MAETWVEAKRNDARLAVAERESRSPDQDWDAYERMQEQARREQEEAAWKAREVRR